MSRALRTLDTPIGRLFLAAEADGLTHATFAPEKAVADGAGVAGPRAAAIVDAAAAQLAEYFAGERREFDLPLRIGGSAFQSRAWREIARIPFGETISYAELAARAGLPRAYRAAGAACGANRIAVIIPCHRVLAADRSLHGYGGGLDKKRWLLEHEGLRIDGAKARQPALLAT